MLQDDYLVHKDRCGLLNGNFDAGVITDSASCGVFGQEAFAISSLMHDLNEEYGDAFLLGNPTDNDTKVDVNIGMRLNSNIIQYIRVQAKIRTKQYRVPPQLQCSTTSPYNDVTRMRLNLQKMSIVWSSVNEAV